MMMDPFVKAAMAACVLTGGVCAAMLFGRSESRLPTFPPAPSAEELLIPGGLKVSGNFNRSGPRSPSAGSRYLPQPEYSPYPRREWDSGQSPATVLTPSREPQQPPPLAEEYPSAKAPTQSHWGQSMGMLLPVPAPGERASRTHKIVDGDTLAALAERFLGSPQRAGDIYEANRAVLFDPQLLPIGVELKIPPK